MGLTAHQHRKATSRRHPYDEKQRILLEEVEIQVAARENRKSERVDKIPTELVLVGGAAIIDDLTKICNKIWKSGKWWAQRTLIITLRNRSCYQTAPLA